MSTGKRIVDLIQNSTSVLILSVLLGLVLPGPAGATEALVTPALMVMMAFSLTEVDLGRDIKSSASLKRGFLGIIINYGLLSGLILLLSYSLPDESLRHGFVIMAAVPPAVAVLPMTRILKGDMSLSFAGEILSYLASLLLMPLIIYLFVHQTGISPIYLLQISIVLILIPALASRLVRLLPINPVLPINLGFFLVTYTVIGLNQGALWTDGWSVAWISIARTFAVGLAVFILARSAGLKSSQAISLTLLGSFKNLGLAAAVSLLLVGPAAGLPAAFCVLAETAFFILLSFARSRYP
ncbi:MULTISPECIES: sodium bile acid symporter family [Methanothrix]|jgi:BASS family bile acid:Na+ symporter|uniref:Sodium bile acid symporter family n=1 Tax=Methanothrix soehngenii (strain ATCC 5969 / DSM 3671 / JCM 10134 / NBRC 103675 / OCM 69 / GP-6) TaxID=990316 RepID=F4BX84_METSG|nr:MULTISPECIES: sodium bile acid symporter family [Methanothrix]AEB68640.1 sodium bile acid symporter family [Methanothrix soehngenii GP6]